MKKIFSLIMATILVFVLSMAIVGENGWAATTAETAIKDECITILYDVESIVIDETSMSRKDKYIYYIDAYTSDKSKWYEVEIDPDTKTARFDLSWSKLGTNTKVYICGDVNTRVTDTIVSWQDTLTVKFTGSLLETDITDSEEWYKLYHDNYPFFGEDTGYFIFTKRVNNRETTYMDLDTIEWRKGSYGNWQEFADLDPHEIEVRGATLEFRIKSNNQTATSAGNRYSSTSRIAVSKIGNGPATTVSKSDGTINLKNGQEFSLDDGEHWLLIPTYDAKAPIDDVFVDETYRATCLNTIKTTVKVNRLLVQDVLGLPSSAAVTSTKILVRNAGGPKAAASKVTEVIIPGTVNFPAAELDNLSMQYVESRTGTGGLQINNDSNIDYQIATIAPKEAAKLEITLPDVGDEIVATASNNLDDIPVNSISWTTLKKNSYTKISYNKAVTGSIILIRKSYTDTEIPSQYRWLPDVVDYTSALTYASISGTPKLGYPLKAIPSTNLEGKTGFTYKWQWANTKNAADDQWTTFFEEETLDITDQIPEGSPAGTQSVYDQCLGKYVRVIIEYNSQKRTSVPVGPIK